MLPNFVDVFVDCLKVLLRLAVITLMALWLFDFVREV